MAKRKKPDERTAYEKRHSFEHLVSTRPSVSTCPKCKRVIMFCYVHGEPTRLEPIRLNLVGEAIALVAGAKTYDMQSIGNRWGFRRIPEMIRRGLPTYGHIYPSHMCGLTYGPEHVDSREIFGTQHQSDEPPF